MKLHSPNEPREDCNPFCDLLGTMNNNQFGKWPHLQIGKHANGHLFIRGTNDSEHHGTWYPLRHESSQLRKIVKEYLKN